MNKACWLAALFITLAACASGSPIRREPPAQLSEFTAEIGVKELWQVRVGSGLGKDHTELVPFIAGDVVYSTDVRGRVRAWARTDGRKRWAVKLDTPVTGGVGGGDGLIVVGTKKGQVVALHAVDGTPAWRVDISTAILAPPAVGMGVVVVQSVDDRLFGLAVRDGARLWVYDQITSPPLTLRGTSAPVIFQDIVLTGFSSGRVVALDLKEGRSLREFPVTLPGGRNEIERLVDVDSSPVVANGLMFAASYQGKIIAVDTRTGENLWTREVSTYTGMDVDQSNVYLTDEHGNVVAFDQRSGASVWRQDKLHGRKLNKPSFVNGYIAVGDFEGYVHWLAPNDGRFVARHRVGDAAIRAKALVDRGTLFVINQDGALAALELARK